MLSMDAAVDVDCSEYCSCFNHGNNSIDKAVITQQHEKLTSVSRRVAFLTATSCVLCLLTVTACSCTAFLFNEFQTTKAELAIKCVVMQTAYDRSSAAAAELLVTWNDAVDYDSDVTSDDLDIECQNELGQDLFGPNKLRSMKKDVRGSRTRKGDTDPLRSNNGRTNPPRSNRRRKIRKNAYNICKCCARRVKHDLMKLGIAPVTGQARASSTAAPETGTTTSKTENNKQLYIGAAHYAAYVDEAYIDKEFGVLDHGNLQNIVDCKYMASWYGELCRNRTFTTPGAPETLNVFKEADWMNHSKTERLFDKTPGGTFIARHTGIYLLYANVLFYDTKTRQAIAIHHEPLKPGAKNNEFRCMESVDYVNPSLTRIDNSKYKSCSVTTVVYMAEGDRVILKNMYANTRIDLTTDATYFGGLLFANHAAT